MLPRRVVLSFRKATSLTRRQGSRTSPGENSAAGRRSPSRRKVTPERSSRDAQERPRVHPRAPLPRGAVVATWCLLPGRGRSDLDSWSRPRGGEAAHEGAPAGVPVRLLTIFPALPSALKGSAASLRCSRQEATCCLVDASSWSPSGKDRVARERRHKKPQHATDASRNDLSRLSGPFLSAPLLCLAVPACVRIAHHRRESRCCDDARRTADIWPTMGHARLARPTLGHAPHWAAQ